MAERVNSCNFEDSFSDIDMDELDSYLTSPPVRTSSRPPHRDARANPSRRRYHFKINSPSVPHDAPRRVRCLTRYCTVTCTTTTAAGMTDSTFFYLSRGYADQKYNEAVAAAGEACADDTVGQTCYICCWAVGIR